MRYFRQTIAAGATLLAMFGMTAGAQALPAHPAATQIAQTKPAGQVQKAGFGIRIYRRHRYRRGPRFRFHLGRRYRGYRHHRARRFYGHRRGYRHYRWKRRHYRHHRRHYRKYGRRYWRGGYGANGNTR